MSETARLGNVQVPRFVKVITGVIAALVLFLGAALLLLWTRRPPPPRYAAKLVAVQWIREPKGKGPHLALCIRVTRRDGSQVPMRGIKVDIPDAQRQGFTLTTAFTQPLPALNTAKMLDMTFIYRPPANGLPTTTLNAQLEERIVTEPWKARLQTLLGQPPDTITQAVAGMPVPVPSPSSRASQVDLTAFIQARKGR